jgi:hypothetical protein
MVAACDAATSGDVDFFASALDLGFIRLISLEGERGTYMVKDFHES